MNIREVHLQTLFAEAAAGGERMAEEAGLRARIDALFRGDKINISGKRAVLHVALRAPEGQSIIVDSEDIVPAVHGVLEKMADFSNRVREGEWKGHTGKPIRNVINGGIGGSDLRPVMAYEALRRWPLATHRRKSGLRAQPNGSSRTKPSREIVRRARSSWSD